MKIFKYSDPGFRPALEAVINRADVDLVTYDATVREILKRIKETGDSALIEYTSRFDHHDLPAGGIKVTPEEIDQAHDQVSDAEKSALKLAAENIWEFHERQVQHSWEYEKNGVLLGQSQRPLETAGIYVPGGKASYPSSVLMNATCKSCRCEEYYYV